MTDSPRLILKIGGDLIERREATFSEDMAYRYLLRIIWDATLLPACFIGLNPSTADEMYDDPTIRRCKDFAKRWGCGGLLMANVFAFRATKPEDMMRATDPVGGTENTVFILSAASQSILTVAAWGNYGSHGKRSEHVKTILKAGGYTVKCFRLCKNGEPFHPLYMAAKTELIDFV